jgi:hypothetical protein
MWIKQSYPPVAESVESLESLKSAITLQLPFSLHFIRGSAPEDMARNTQHSSIIPTKRTPGHIQMHHGKGDTGTSALTMQVAGAQVVIIVVLLLFITAKHEAVTCPPRDTKPPTLISSSRDRR